MSCCGCGCWYCVQQSEVAVIESCGKFKEIRGPGCTCLTPCVDAVAGTVTLRLLEHFAAVESKTKDNVFVSVKISIQYQVVPDYIRNAFYTLAEPTKLIDAYVYSVIRSKIPSYDIDALYIERITLAQQLKEEVDDQMQEYGFDIANVLITAIDIAPQIAQAMNRILSSELTKKAKTDEAETRKLRIIRTAEADSAAKRLSGIGLAEQRKAIVTGLQSTIEGFRASLDELDSDEIMGLLLMNQYFDALKDAAAEVPDTTMVLQHDISLPEIFKQMMQSTFGHTNAIPGPANAIKDE